MQEVVPNQELPELSRAFFTPRLIQNISVSISEESNTEGEVVESGIKLDVIGFSKESAGTISIDHLPPGGAQNLLHSFLALLPDHVPEAQVDGEDKIPPVPVEALEKFLEYACKIGGKPYSDDLGIYPEFMAANYAQILDTMKQREPSRIEYLERKLDRPEKWEIFKRDLISNVRDQNVLVWIRVETPPGTGIVAEQRLGYIIEKHLMQSSKQLSNVLKESWFENRGKSYTLPVVKNLPKNNFEVVTSEIQILMHTGFMMTVVDNSWDLKGDLYQVLQDKENDSQARFVLEAVHFSLEKNHELVQKLDKVHKQLKARLKKKQIEDFDILEEDSELLEDSARELFYASDNYITILNSLNDDFFKPDELNIRDEILAYAKKIMELSEGLKTDTEELSEKVQAKRQEKREDFFTKLSIAAITTIGVSNGLTSPAAWRDLMDVANLAYIGILTVTAYFGTRYALNKWTGTNKK